MTDYRTPSAGPGRRGSSRIALILLPLVAFLLGLAAMGWLLVNWEPAAEYLGIRTAATVAQQSAQAQTAVPPQQATPPQAAPQEQPQTLLIDPEMQRRVTMLEQRIAEVGNQSRAAVGNADRAEGLLVAFAARRAIDRGVALGYVEGLLRQRFGRTQPQAVATVIASSRQPVTLEDLQEGLLQVGPSLTGGAPDQDWWTGFRAELSELVTIRREGAPSTLPDERLTRATGRLEAGQVDVALAEVLRLPGRDKAQSWISAARRYVAARGALDTIETAALTEPQEPQALAFTPTPVAGRPE